MLLTRLRGTVIRLRRDDEGVAMAAVLGLMAVSALLTALVAGSVITSMGQTSATRAGVQSQAAAEAGIAVARAGLIAGTCTTNGGVYQSASGATPAYKATIWIPQSASTWMRACPVGTASQVRILSTGYASSPGVSGDTAGDTTNVEAVLSAASGGTSLAASGPAIYAYSAGSFANSGTLISPDGMSPDVLIKNGDVDCTGASANATDLVVNNGSLIVDNSCVISGNAWASGRMTFVGTGKVAGNAVANGVTMGGSGTVGRIWSSSDLTTTGSPVISGVVKAKSLSLGGGTLNGNAYIYGAMKVTNAGASTLNKPLLTQSLTAALPGWWTSLSKVTVQNPIATPSFAIDLPSAPFVPNWVDFGARADDYTSSAWVGFTVYTMGSACDAAHVAAAVAALGSNPGVLDGRACSGTLAVDGSTVITASNDLAIIAKNIHIGNSGTIRANSARRLWLINPDTVANQAPTCSGQSVVVDGAASFPNESVMLYSPCAITLTSGNHVTGQVYGGTVSTSGAAVLTYTAIGLPGYNLDQGTATSTVTTEADRTLSSQRNVTATN